LSKKDVAVVETWSEEELKAAVVAYIDMRNKEAAGTPFVKKHYYSDLASRFGRTEKSYEYRMQNITYVYSLLGRDWVTGLKPAKNVGSNAAEIIERLIFEVEGQELPSVAAFESKVAAYKAKKSLSKPEGQGKPKATGAIVTHYQRDPKVKAWVLQQAEGVCECCGSPAPFKTASGEPYLEVHHLRRLADGGSDTISNAVALCPNCHRELHYGLRMFGLMDLIYKKISRLAKEKFEGDK
jgi:5-methylcytosine-specific restriction protein A